jgi:hypothetical protein
LISRPIFVEFGVIYRVSNTLGSQAVGVSMALILTEKPLLNFDSNNIANVGQEDVGETLPVSITSFHDT